MEKTSMRVRIRRAILGASLLAAVAGVVAASPGRRDFRTEEPWTSGGYRPARTHQKIYPSHGPDLTGELRERIPGHMDPLDLRAREAFGDGVIEIGEAIKAALVEDGVGLRAAFSGGPYAVTEVLAKGRAPAFYPHDYGVGYAFTLVLRGRFESGDRWVEPLHFDLDLDLLVGEDGMVRADVRPRVDASPEGAAGSPEPQRSHILAAAQHVVDSSGPLELQGIEARIRDVVRRTLTLSRPAPGRRVPNPFREEIYAALIRSPGPAEPTVRRRSYDLDLDGNGRPDPEKLVVVNRVRRVERGPVTRGGPPRFDFRSYAGWELYVGDEERPVLARPHGRLKFCLVGDTDGDGLPDMILVEDHAESRVHHDPYEPIHEAFLRPAVYFLDGQDMARGVFDLGPVRFDFPPGADGSEIRSLRFVPRHGPHGFADWDVAVEVFDPVGRLLDRSLVFDRFPANRRPPTEVGYQRAEFAGSQPEALRGVRFRVHFAVNDHVLDTVALKELERAMGEVGSGAVVRARVVGHTCEAQSYAHNLALGRRRARSVASCLAAMGIHPDRTTVESRGEYDPIESNTNGSGQSMNRRVDGWLMVRPADPSTPPWYGRVGVAADPDVRTRRQGFRN